MYATYINIPVAMFPLNPEILDGFLMIPKPALVEPTGDRRVVIVSIN